MEWIKWKRGGRWVDNDEGYHYAYCHACCRKTEHDLHSCIECDNRAIRRRQQAARKQVREVQVGDYTVKIYPNGKRYCNCKGFKFRKACKHIGMAV